MVDCNEELQTVAKTFVHDFKKYYDMLPHSRILAMNVRALIMNSVLS